MADYRRITLNTSLNNIAEGKEVEENVKKAVEVIASYSLAADRTIFRLKDRPESEWLRQGLDYCDLRTIGNYKMRRQKSKNKQEILFQRSDLGVGFYFVRGDVNISEGLIRMIESGEEIDGSEMKRNLFVGAFTGKSLDEIRLGKSARNLDAFELDHVDIIRVTPVYLLGTPVWNKNQHTIVYRTNSKI